MQKKLCKYCGDYFITPHSYKIACSKKECKEKYHHEKSYLKSICEICGKEFEYRKSKPKRFCSKKCAQASPEVKEKMVKSQKETFMEKYGVEHPMKLTSIRQHFTDSMVEKYGVEHALQDPDILKKHEETKLKLYGDKHYSNIDKIRTSLHNSQYDFIKQYFSEKNIELLFTLDEYKGNDYINKYKFKCSVCGNIFSKPLFKLDYIFCAGCNPNKFTYETDIYNFLKEILGNECIIDKNNRSIIDGELDLYIPSHKFAIEFDGIFWHSEVSGNKNKNYHLNKTKMCEELGISLIHIFETEWLCSNKKVKSILSQKLGKCTQKIYARNCNISEITNEQKNYFLNQNHIQGTSMSSYDIGLFFKNELVSVMTFSKPKYDKKYEWEISRYASVLNTTIIGGASKLFRFFIKNKKPESIVTYTDRRYFTGDLYEKMGFNYLNDTKQNYWYIDLKKMRLYSRQSFQKHMLAEKLDIYDAQISEWENMQLNGYDRIWDCGNKKFEWVNDRK